MVLCFIRPCWDLGGKCSSFLEDVRSIQSHKTTGLPHMWVMWLCQARIPMNCIVSWSHMLHDHSMKTEMLGVCDDWSVLLCSVLQEGSSTACCSDALLAIKPSGVNSTPYSKKCSKKGQIYWLFIGLLITFLILLPGVHQVRHLCTALTFSASWKNTDPLVLHWPSSALFLGKTEIRTESPRIVKGRNIFLSIKDPLQLFIIVKEVL